MTRQPDPISPRGATQFSDDAWVEVLSAVDRTYADLLSYQEQLEAQNAELQEMRTFLTAILGSVSDVLVVADAGGRIAQVSRSVLTLTARTEDDIRGMALETILAPDQRWTLATTLAAVRETRRSWTIACDLVTPGGTEPLELSVAPRLNDRGRVDGFVLTGRPMGALRQAYAQLSESHAAMKAAQSYLVRNEKLAALGRLLAGVAHELNNPISFVYANAHALERYAGKFETYFARVQDGASRDELIQLRRDLRLDRELANLRDAIDGARDGAVRVREIVEDLRRLSSDGSGEQVAFDLSETVRVAASWVMRGRKEPVPLTMDPMEKVEVTGRAGHIQQVVMNLVQNAVDALEGRSDGAIRLSVERTGDRAVLTVTDNGPGIPHGLRASIFDPFFTTKPVGRGTGLGLSISHKIAEEHGGTLSLCEVPQGACFRLSLPAGGAP